MSINNNTFYVENGYINSINSSSVGKLLELSWDNPKYITNLKGLFQLLETKYIANCDFPSNPNKLKTYTLEFLQAEPSKQHDFVNDQISDLEVAPNLNFSFFLLKTIDDIKSCMISLDLMKRILSELCKSDNSKTINQYISKVFDRERLQFHPELLQRLNNLDPLEKECISRSFCALLLSANIKNRDFYNFLLTNSFIFDIIDFSTGHKFWSHVPLDLIEQNHYSLLNTLNVSNIDFYSYLPKFYHLLENAPDECDQLLTFIKNKDFNTFLLLIFNLFINKMDLLK